MKTKTAIFIYTYLIIVSILAWFSREWLMIGWGSAIILLIGSIFFSD